MLVYELMEGQTGLEPANILLGRQTLWPIELLPHIEVFSLDLCINIISRFSRKIKFLLTNFVISK